MNPARQESCGAGLAAIGVGFAKTRVMKIILRIISIIAFPAVVISIFFFLIISPRPNPIHHYLIWSLLLFVIANWINWGIWGGAITLGLISIVTVYSWMLTGTAAYLLVNIPALILVLLLYIRSEHIKLSVTNFKLNLDHEERTYNLLLQDYKKQEGLQEAYYKKSKRFARLSQIAKNLGFSLAPEEINRQIISDLTKTIDTGDTYLLWEVGVDLQSLALKALESPGGISKPEDINSDEFNLWTMRHRQPLLVTDVAKDYRFDTAKIIKKSSTKSLIMAPLMTGNKIMGIVRIDSFLPETFSIDDLRLLAIIANIAALTIQNAKLFKETEYLATRDGLTGLYVKRYCLENLERLLKEAGIKGSSFSVFLIDLDKFKLLNDQYGHSVGDKVLQRVAELIREGAGEGSISARYGGEEFVVLLPNTTKAEALQVAEKIRKQVAAEILLVRREGIHTTISIGIAFFPVDGDNAISLLDKADKALYQAKHKGRNRVISA